MVNLLMAGKETSCSNRIGNRWANQSINFAIFQVLVKAGASTRPHRAEFQA